MCGFVGMLALDPRERQDAALVARMARTLAHRGPDDEVVETGAGWALGFRRLAVIDVAGGAQPLWNETHDVALVCNGEIYNFEELRVELERAGHRFRTNSDAETLVHLYEEHGDKLCERLRGMYAFALIDLRDQRVDGSGAPRLLLGRDRLGIKPLYWALDRRGLWFASEPKALLEGGAAPRSLRAEALLDYLVCGYVPGPRAAWSGMERVPQASTLAWDRVSPPRTKAYWDLPLAGPRDTPDPAEILEWIDRVVAEHLVSDVPLGAFLSGGIDSSAVVDSMARARGQKGRAARSLDAGLALCTVGFREEEFDELERARATAERLGATHYAEILEPDPKLALDVLPWHFDEPLADPSALPTLLVSRMARRHVTVALSGDGGDEVFAGYRRYVFDVAENRARTLLGPHATRALAALGRRWPRLEWAPRPLRARSTLENLGRDPARAYWASLTRLSRTDAVELLAPDLRARLAQHDPFDAFAEHYRRPRWDDPLYRAQYADVHHFLPDQILVKTDRASMAASLELRPPLLDHRFVERFATLPARDKVRHGRGKHALREALRTRLPADLLDGPKRGFDVPLAAWLRGPLAPAARAAVERLPAAWFDRAALQRRWAEHQSGWRDHSDVLWSLLVLDAWRERHAVTGLEA